MGTGKGTAESDAEEKGAPARKTEAEKRIEYLDRVRRTAIASILGIGTGVVSFLISDMVTGFLVMIIGIVLQRYIFPPIRRGLPELGAKDWFYQSFMTFSLWFISLTILLTASP